MAELGRFGQFNDREIKKYQTEGLSLKEIRRRIRLLKRERERTRIITYRYDSMRELPKDRDLESEDLRAIMGFAAASLSSERAGIVQEPSFQLQGEACSIPEIENATPLIYRGQIYPAEGKPYAADHIAIQQWIEPGTPFGPVGFSLAYIFDGATMLVGEGMWPQSVKKRSSFSTAKGQVVYPDIFWRTTVEHAISTGNLQDDQAFPDDFRKAMTPFTMPDYLPGAISSRHQYLQNIVTNDFAREFVDHGRRIRACDTAKKIIEDINITLWQYFQGFSDYTSSSFCLFPSGIAGVSVVIRPLTLEGIRKAIGLGFKTENLVGWAHTGDISISAQYPNRRVFTRLNNPVDVDEHDNIRLQMAKFMSVADQSNLGQLAQLSRWIEQNPDQFLFLIAMYRAPLIGNLPLPGEFHEDLSRAIRTGTLTDIDILRDGYPAMMMRTDGMNNMNTGGLTVWDQQIHAARDRLIKVGMDTEFDSYEEKFDDQATKIARDPRLAVLDLRHQYLMGGKKLKVQDKKRHYRGDDGAFIYIGPREGISVENFSTPLLF